MNEQVTKEGLRARLDELRRDLHARMENLSLRLTVRMGVMLAAGLTFLGAVIKMH